MNKIEKIIEWLSEMDKDEWVEILDCVSIEQDGRMRALVDELNKTKRAKDFVDILKRKVEEL